MLHGNQTLNSFLGNLLCCVYKQCLIRVVTISDFHCMIIVAKRIHSNIRKYKKCNKSDLSLVLFIVSFVSFVDSREVESSVT